MNEKTVDARGELCPRPLIMTKKALKELDGELSVLLDNETAFENVKRFLSDNGRVFSESCDGTLFVIKVTPGGSTSEMSSPEDYCTIPVTVTPPSASGNSSYIIVFDSQYMGRGDDDLGGILIQGFSNTIKELDTLPEALVFYNSGVRLAMEGSSVLPAFRELEEKGLKILVCGTCSDYFGIKDKIAVGIISNMYDIMDCLTRAQRIVKP